MDPSNCGGVKGKLPSSVVHGEVTQTAASENMLSSRAALPFD